MRTLQGRGEAHVVKGDLGELPAALRLFKLLNLSRATKTAFDTADVAMPVRDGRTTLAPIQLTGDAFSLRGAGTLDTQGDLNLRLRLLYGRDSWHIRGLSDAIREASGNIFDIHVTGPVASPSTSWRPSPSPPTPSSASSAISSAPAASANATRNAVDLVGRVSTRQASLWCEDGVILTPYGSSPFGAPSDRYA